MTDPNVPDGPDEPVRRRHDIPPPGGGGWRPEPIDPIQFRIEKAREVLSTRIPVRFQNATVEHQQVAGWVRQFLDDPASARSLLLVGRTGTGKTHMAWGAVRTVVEGLAGQGRGLVWRATSHPDMNAALRPRPDGSHHGVLETLMKADLLFLDDLGAGKSTDWTEDTLYRLVDHRWSNRLPTIYSTNHGKDTAPAVLGERVMSRLGEAVRVAVMGDDRRWNA